MSLRIAHLVPEVAFGASYPLHCVLCVTARISPLRLYTPFELPVRLMKLFVDMRTFYDLTDRICLRKRSN